MKAKNLEPGDVVFFSNGNVCKVESAERPNTDFFRVYVVYDCFTTVYNSEDELLVARKGQIL